MPQKCAGPVPRQVARRLARQVTAIAASAGFIAACLNGNAEPIVRVAADSGAPGPVPDSATPASTCDPNATALPFYYRNVQPSADASGIDFIFKIANNSGAALPLSELSARYYFTNEITGTPQTAVFYSGTCCGDTRTNFASDVFATVVAIAPAEQTATADHYLEVTFDAGAGLLQPGDAVQIEPSYFGLNHAQTLNQANDFSFVAAQTSTQAEWDSCPTACAQFGSCLITVYRNGTLIWGSPPM